MFCSFRYLQFNCIFRLSQWQHRILRTGSPWRDFIPFIVALFHTHVVEKTWTRVCDQKSSNIWHFTKVWRLFWFLYHLGCLLAGILPFKKCLNLLMNTTPTSEWHLSYYDATPAPCLHLSKIRHMLSSFSAKQESEAAPSFQGKLLFEQSFFDAENHSSTSCKSFEAVHVGLLSWHAA